MSQIMALFSVENDYNQPSNNLVAFWPFQPTHDQVSLAISEHQGYEGNYMKGSNEFMRFVGDGMSGRIGNTDYSLEWVSSGQTISRR